MGKAFCHLGRWRLKHYISKIGLITTATSKFAKRAVLTLPWFYGYGQMTARQMDRVQPPAHPPSFLLPRLPRGGGQCDEQGLEDATDKDNGVLSGDEEVERGQDEEAMNHQPAHHSDCVVAQLLSNSRGVVHLQDLASDEENNAKGEVPGGGAGQLVPVLARRGSQAALALHRCLA